MDTASGGRLVRLRDELQQLWTGLSHWRDPRVTLAKKRAARIGRAVVDRETCLPYARREACQLCVDECAVAGYNAIEFLRVGTEVDDAGEPVEGSGFLAPVVLADKCVGCGLCQTRCLAINGVEKKLVRESAIRVEAGEGREDRLAASRVPVLRSQGRQTLGEGSMMSPISGEIGHNA